MAKRIAIDFALVMSKRKMTSEKTSHAIPQAGTATTIWPPRGRLPALRNAVQSGHPAPSSRVPRAVSALQGLILPYDPVGDAHRANMHPGWLSNAYVLGDEPGGTAVFVDSGARSSRSLRSSRASG